MTKDNGEPAQAPAAWGSFAAGKCMGVTTYADLAAKWTTAGGDVRPLFATPPAQAPSPLVAGEALQEALDQIMDLDGSIYTVADAKRLAYAALSAIAADAPAPVAKATGLFAVDPRNLPPDGYMHQLVAVPEDATIAKGTKLYAAAPALPAGRGLREALQRIVDWDDSGLALTEDHIAQAKAALAASEPAPLAHSKSEYKRRVASGDTNVLPPLAEPSEAEGDLTAVCLAGVRQCAEELGRVRGALQDLIQRCEYDGIPNDTQPYVDAAKEALASRAPNQGAAP